MAGRDTYFDKLGEDFDHFMSDYDVERRHQLIFRGLLGSPSFRGQRVLEVGCGTGRFSATIAHLEAHLIALDIGRNLVARVVSEVPCSGVVGDACALPFQEGSFDAVISSECIEHTPDPFEAIREMCRVCRPGGVVCFTTPNKVWYPVLLISQKLRLRKFKGVENWIFPADAIAVIKEAGMGDIRVSGCHLWPFQLKLTRVVLRSLDAQGPWLYPAMINFGVACRKPVPSQT